MFVDSWVMGNHELKVQQHKKNLYEYIQTLAKPQNQISMKLQVYLKPCSGVLVDFTNTLTTKEL